MSHGALRVLFSAALAALSSPLLVSPVGAAQPVPLRVTVQAQPRFTDLAGVMEADGALTVRGRLMDDTASPIRGALIRARPANDGRPVRLASCAAGASAPARRGALTLVTDEAGAFCIRAAGDAAPTLDLEFSGTPVLLPASARFDPSAARTPRRLAFESPSIELDLDRPEQRLQLILPEPFPPESIGKVLLTLHEADREQPLAGSDWHREGNLLRFALRSSDLGGPGPARLVASLTPPDAGESLLAETVALRVARVRLSAEVISRETERASVGVLATAAGAAPTTGWIEVTRGDQSVATAPLQAGRALLELPLGPEQSSFMLSYQAEDPWWLPGAPLELVLEAVAQPEPRRWPWLVLLMPVGWVCLRALQRPAPRRARPPKRPRARAPEPAAAAPAAMPVSGWSGRVYDAHDGWPVPGAVIELALPSMRADAGTLSTRTDDTGAFTLPAIAGPVPEGARLRVSAALHTEVERALPPQGRVDIAMMSRKRTLLRRLVRWARAMGPPWNRTAEPTPREIADVALRRGEPQTARWAESIEQAAFGAIVVDGAHEASLRAQEPPWKHSGRQREDEDAD